MQIFVFSAENLQGSDYDKTGVSNVEINWEMIGRQIRTFLENCSPSEITAAVGGVLWTIVVWMCIRNYCRYKQSFYSRQSGRSYLSVLMDKGARGEYRTSIQLEEADFEYRLLFNCYIPGSNGEKSEIDIIMVSEKGIYVVENKNYSGHIIGTEDSKNWYEILGGKRYYFYNPVKQNQGHVRILKSFLGSRGIKYVSLITFNKNADFKKIRIRQEDTYVLRQDKIRKFIKKQRRRPDVLTNQDIEKICRKLEPCTQMSNREKKRHIRRIRRRYRRRRR